MKKVTQIVDAFVLSEEPLTLLPVELTGATNIKGYIVNKEGEKKDLPLVKIVVEYEQ